MRERGGQRRLLLRGCRSPLARRPGRSCRRRSCTPRRHPRLSPPGRPRAKPPVTPRARGTATGIRTPVSAVRGRRPSPLDDGGADGDHASNGLGAIVAAPDHADVAELVDARRSGRRGRKLVEVRVLSSACRPCVARACRGRRPGPAAAACGRWPMPCQRGGGRGRRFPTSTAARGSGRAVAGAGRATRTSGAPGLLTGRSTAAIRPDRGR